MIKDTKTRVLMYLVVYLFVLARTMLLISDFRAAYRFNSFVALFAISTTDIIVIVMMIELFIWGGRDGEE